jgi:exopolysaccharide production protein ExoY
MPEIAKPISDARVSREIIAPVGGVIKRLTDIVLATVAIGLMLPLLVFCSVATLLASGGRIIARQRSVGFRGRAFECLSFETSAEARVTRLGAVLREGGLDELPRLFNVLRGDMSIVGRSPSAVTSSTSTPIRQRPICRASRALPGSGEFTARRAVSSE